MMISSRQHEKEWEKKIDRKKDIEWSRKDIGQEWFQLMNTEIRWMMKW